MHAVVNHLYLNVSVDSICQAAKQSLLPIFKSLSGFREINLVKAGEDHLIVIILWEDLNSANHGASVIGPTWFAQNIIPYLKSEQQRSVGEVGLHYKV